jgi:hypothetical protein
VRWRREGSGGGRRPCVSATRRARVGRARALEQCDFGGRAEAYAQRMRTLARRLPDLRGAPRVAPTVKRAQGQSRAHRMPPPPRLGRAAAARAPRSFAIPPSQAPTQPSDPSRCSRSQGMYVISPLPRRAATLGGRRRLQRPSVSGAAASAPRRSGGAGAAACSDESLGAGAPHADGAGRGVGKPKAPAWSSVRRRMLLNNLVRCASPRSAFLSVAAQQPDGGALTPH